MIREGLRLLKEKEEVHQGKLEHLRREIQIGIDQADSGQVSTFNKETLKEIKAKGVSDWLLNGSRRRDERADSTRMSMVNVTSA